MLTQMKKREKLSPNKRERLNEGVKIWTDFYRQNIHRFVADYLGIQLKPFQVVLLYMIEHNLRTCLITSRGLGKSWLIALYCCCRCILYPGQKIIVSCETKEQSRNLIREKIVNELMSMSPNLKKEINPKEVKIGTNESYVKFKNGSTITAINASENTRGRRAHILVVDEYVQIKNGFDTLTKILQPFLQVVRQPKYLQNPLYSKYREENKQIYMSSAWWADHWSYNLYKDYVEKMLVGESSFACNLPYTIALKYGLMTETRLDEILDDPNMSDEAFLMEYCAQFFDLGNGAYIKPSDIIGNRTVVKPWYPPTNLEYISEKNKRKQSWVEEKTSDNELRVIGCDIALAQGNKNDNTVIHYSVSIPKGDKYITEIKYSEAINGGTAKSIALRLKQLYYDGICDYIVMDLAGLGLAVYDALCEYTYDEERDIKYPPMCCFNKEDKKERCGYKEAVPCIYGVIANEEINNDIAVTLKASLNNHTLKFLVNEFEGEDWLNENKNFQLLDNEEKVRLMYPYVQTTLTQMEIIKLQTEVTRKGIKLVEFGTNRKDRYSALAYLNLFIREMEKKLKRPKNKGNFLSLW